MKKTLEAHGRLIDGSFFTDARTADYFEEQRETEGEPRQKKWFLVKAFSEDAADEDDFSLVARSRLLDGGDLRRVPDGLTRGHLGRGGSMYVTPNWLHISHFAVVKDDAQSHEQQAERCWELTDNETYRVYVKLYGAAPKTKLKKFCPLGSQWVVKIHTDKVKMTIREEEMLKSRFLEALRFANLHFIAFKMETLS